MCSLRDIILMSEIVTVQKTTWLSLWESWHAEGVTERALSAPSGHLSQRERQVRCSRASALNCNLNNKPQRRHLH